MRELVHVGKGPDAVANPVAALNYLGAKWSPAFSRDGELSITSRDCVICGPSMDCICSTIEFGSPEYMARLDKLHGRTA
jgi:hypothetical protein